MRTSRDPRRGGRLNEPDIEGIISSLENAAQDLISLERVYNIRRDEKTAQSVGQAASQVFSVIRTMMELRKSGDNRI